MPAIQKVFTVRSRHYEFGFYWNLLDISQTTFAHCRARFYTFFLADVSKARTISR